MPFVEWLGTWPGAVLLQRSGTAYLFVNAAHIASVGLLIGGILPLDLRLAGLLRGVPLAVIGPFLSRSAAIGVALAIATGLWLFTVKPREYLENEAFLWKMALLALGAGQHRRAAPQPPLSARARRRRGPPQRPAGRRLLGGAVACRAGRRAVGRVSVRLCPDRSTKRVRVPSHRQSGARVVAQKVPPTRPPPPSPGRRGGC